MLKPEDIYIHVFAPDRINMRNPDDVLYDKKTDGQKYSQNKSVDVKEINEVQPDGSIKKVGDGRILRRELLDRYYEKYEEGEKSENLFKGKCECFEEKEEPKSIVKWHDPVDNPMLCLYTQKANSNKLAHGSFGYVRDGGSIHAGVDLFANVGTPIYACVDAVVDRVWTSTSLAGNCISLKVSDSEFFKTNYNKSFQPKYQDKGEIVEKNFSVNKPIYLVYMHLSKITVSEKQKVRCGDPIGLTGVSGNNGKSFKTANPHLHFEIANVSGHAGLDYKCNALMFVRAKYQDGLTENEISLQNEAKDKYSKSN